MSDRRQAPPFAGTTHSRILPPYAQGDRRAVRACRQCRPISSSCSPGPPGTGVEVNAIGSGSNLLVADEGVPGLVLKLDRELTAIELDGTSLTCGGGARLPSVAAHAARHGLSGIEFGVNIPGTVGGAVRMNANAYGGALASVLDWALVVSASGSQRRSPAELGFAYRSSNLGAGEIVASAGFSLMRRRSRSVKATLAQMRARRHEAQPQGIKTFGSTFKNPDDPLPKDGPRGCCSHRPTATDWP